MIKNTHTTATKEQHGFCIILLALLGILLPSCQKKLSPSVQSAHQLLWIDADSCYQQLLDIEDSRLAPMDRAYYRVCYEHARLRTIHGIDSIPLLIEAANLLADAKYNALAAEAYYVLGSFYSLSDNINATYFLKHAEEQLQLAENANDHLWGLVYYRLGKISTKERMFEVANSYFRQAIPYLDDNILFKACAYRDYANSLYDDSIEVAITYLDSALACAIQIPDSLVKIEIESTILFVSKDTTQAILNKYKTLCCEYKQYLYAGHIAELYLSKNQLDSAERYIEILAYDTAYNVWSKEHYYSLQSQLLATRGQYKPALEILSSLHNWQTMEIENGIRESLYNLSTF